MARKVMACLEHGPPKLPKDGYPIPLLNHVGGQIRSPSKRDKCGKPLVNLLHEGPAVWTSGNLEEFGFLRAGECKLDGTKKYGVRFGPSKMKEERVVYSFTVEGGVRYIGVCGASTTTLGGRMRSYQSSNEGTTNIENRELIRESLQMGRCVEIFAFNPSGYSFAS